MRPSFYTGVGQKSPPIMAASKLSQKRDSIVGLVMKESAALVEAFKDYDDVEAISEEEDPTPPPIVKKGVPATGESKEQSNTKSKNTIPSHPSTPKLKHKQDNNGSLNSIPKAIYTIDSHG